MMENRMTDVEQKLSSDTFDVLGYMKELAKDKDSSVELKAHRKVVQSVAEQTAQKLKQNVYENYSLFINTSKEISSLEAEMYQLSHMLNEHKSLTRNLSHLALTASPCLLTDPGAEPEKHSIASLLETVEGCSSVTEVPGRFLIYSSHLTELHQETYKELQVVQAFLLNDSLMIAAHNRRRRGPVRYRFQALYELDNMAVVEVKDSDAIKNAFKILMFPDSHLYHAEAAAMKQTWMELLEDTKQKHKISRDALRKEMSDRSSLSRHHPPPPHFFPHSPPPPPLTQTPPPPRPPHEPMKLTRGLSHQFSEAEQRQADCFSVDTMLKDAPEALDVCIAQREFNQATELIERTKGYLKNFSDSHALRDVRARINHRITQLSAILMKELESSPSGSLRGGPRAARRAVGLLIRLGHSPKACELFLLNHKRIIFQDLKDVKREEGAVILYVGNSSAVFFSGLRNAALEFRRAFGSNNGSYSSFIVWCINQLRAFCDCLNPLIFTNTPLSTVAECLAAIGKECDSLHAMGIDLNSKLMRNFHSYICSALTAGKDEVLNRCSLSATPETWKPLDFSNDQPQLAAIVIEMEKLGIMDFKNRVKEGNVVDISQSTITFCQCILAYVDETMRFYTPDLLLYFIDCVCDIFNHMVVLYIDALKRDENIPANDFIIADAEFIVETLLPAVGKMINSQTRVQIPNFLDLHESLVKKLSDSTTQSQVVTRAVEGNQEETGDHSDDSMA